MIFVRIERVCFVKMLSMTLYILVLLFNLYTFVSMKIYMNMYADTSYEYIFPKTLTPTLYPSALTLIPTLSPVTSIPTLSPRTSLPTFSPTYSPLGISDSCVPGLVTCCFTVGISLVEIYVDDMELTSSVILIKQVFSLYSTYVVSFVEPSNNATIAIKGFDGSEITSAGLRLSCNSTRVGSGWNFVSAVSTGWRSVSSIRVPDYTANNFVSGWYLNNFTGVSQNSPAYSLNLNLNLPFENVSCSQTDKAIGHGQGGTTPRSFYWASRKNVEQSIRCGTRSPFFHPSRSPSRSPVSSTPTRSPTSSTPTESPTFSAPTKLPTSPAPTKSPTSSVPTKSPTCVAGVVTCCFSAFQVFLQFIVNDIDLTSSIVHGSQNSTGVITFSEPVNSAMIAIKGFKNHEIVQSTLFIICNCTRASSPWNFDTTVFTTGEWKTISSLSVDGEFHPYWFNSMFNGTLSEYSDKIGNSVVPTYSGSYLNTSVCGGYLDYYQGVRANPFVVFPSFKYWAQRKFVTQNIICET